MSQALLDRPQAAAVTAWLAPAREKRRIVRGRTASATEARRQRVIVGRGGGSAEPPQDGTRSRRWRGGQPEAEEGVMWPYFILLVLPWLLYGGAVAYAHFS